VDVERKYERVAMDIGLIALNPYILYTGKNEYVVERYKFSESGNDIRPGVAEILHAKGSSRIRTRLS